MAELEDDSMRDFLDELDLIPTPAEEENNGETSTAGPQDTRTSETTELIDSLLADTDEAAKATMKNVKTETPKAAMTQQLRSSFSSPPKPVTPTSVAKPKTPKPKPAAKLRTLRPAPIQVPTRDGLTMYDRSKVQMEQREMKLKALQQQLESDYTFAPRSSTPKSRDNSAEGNAEAVFDRLYATETASSRAAYANTPKRDGTNTPRRTPRRKSNDSSSALSPGSRVEALYASGQKNLRAKGTTNRVSSGPLCDFAKPSA
jgi:hypothetical protein